MGNDLIEFWLCCVVAGVIALAVVQKRSFLAVFVLPLSVAIPLALATSAGPQGPRFPSLGMPDVVGACLLVLALNLIGMKLGGYRFVFFPPYPGRGTTDPHDRS